MIDGMINVYKEAGYTSHDVVAKLRGILHQRKVGHTGTLDPEAVGVLPVCLGKGTRLCDMLTNMNKTYQVEMLLGKETDTQDMTGKVLAEKPVRSSEEEIRRVINSFIGECQQIPPMYSAVKVNGKKLYQLAREGIEIERKARKVTFYSINVVKIDRLKVAMEVICSKGTYIRTLCHDIGRKLGCGAAMESLVRSCVGPFSIEDSVSLKDIEDLQIEGNIGQVVHSIEELLKDYPSYQCVPEMDKLLSNGNPLPADILTGEQIEGWIRVCNSQGDFVAVYELRQGSGKYYPVKMFS